MDRATPRSNPNYDVFFSEEKIKTVIKRSLPHVKDEHMNIEHLPSGKSFNNRIYFVNLAEPIHSTRPDWSGAEVDVERTTRQIYSSSLVLKIAGHPFGANKIQNEVACLLLLERYCPSIPAPKLLSWSDDGQKIRTPLYSRGFRESEPKHNQVIAAQASDGVDVNAGRVETTRQGFIVMTREPGRPITPEDLLGPWGDKIMRQIAVQVATWRKNMTPAHAVGNLRLVGKNSKPSSSAICYDKAILPGLDVHIDGLITNAPPPSPLATCQLYTTYVLRCALKRLKEGGLYGHISDEVYDMVKRMTDKALPKLPMFQRQGTVESMIFTHDDLSGRNVLVSTTDSGTLAVSAMIDFEFAGFFPKDEEFAHHMQNEQEEWPLDKYGVFLAALKKAGALPESLAQPLFPPPPPATALPSSSLPTSTSLHTASAGPNAQHQHQHQPRDKAFDFGGPEFHQAVLLLRIAINTAPWWIKEEQSYSAEQLKRELDDAKRRVETAVRWLEDMVPEKGRRVTL